MPEPVARDESPRTVDADVVRWVEELTGGRAVRWSSQPRWRPMWFVDVEVDDQITSLIVRGERTDVPMVFPLDHEMRFQRVLDEHEIPVPHVYGWNDEHRCFAMASVPGRPDFAGIGPQDRDRIVDQYLEALVRLHSLPIEPFTDAGVVQSNAADGAARVGLDRFEQAFRQTKVRPDPLMEFMLGWLRRHPIPHAAPGAAVVWDSGQFHHDNVDLVALVDLELGHVGDPMMDLAGWRLRDTIIPFGDFPRLYERYEQLGGRPVDLAAIQFHVLAFTLTNQLTVHRALAAPRPDTDYMTYAHWVSDTNLLAVETLAELLGLDLAAVPIPEPEPTPVAEPHAHLSRTLRSIHADDPLVAYEIRKAFRLARHLARFAEIGAELAEQDRSDVAVLTRTSPADWDAADRELEQFVLADSGRHDGELVELFHRRCSRYKALMGPPGSAMATHHRMQPLGRSLLA